MWRGATTNVVRLVAMLWLAVWGLSCRPSAADLRPNVVVFVLDAARADHFGCYGYDRETTPHVDRLARRGTVFSTARSEAAYTFASAGALMTGRLPASSGLLLPEPVPDSLPLLAELARRSGYATYAYSESPVVSVGLGFARGFDRFDEASPYEAYLQDRQNFPVFRSEERIDAALDWMAARGPEPFLAYLHVLRPHNPYHPPAAQRGRFGSGADPVVDGSTRALLAMDAGRLPATEAQLAHTIALYDENLAYGDALFGQLDAGLERLGLASSTVVVVTSDHGEGFREHGRMLHSSTVFDEMLAIPLVIAHPGDAGGRRIPTPVQLADLSRTLAGIFVGDAAVADLDVFQGRSLLPAVLRGEAPAERAVLSWSLPAQDRVALRLGSLKLIARASRPDALTEARWYDLARDPGERAPQPVVGNTRAEGLARGLQEISASWRRGPDAGRVPLDPEIRMRLESLGYLDDMLGAPQPLPPDPSR